jgi:hypothetical protein
VLRTAIGSRLVRDHATPAPPSPISASGRPAVHHLSPQTLSVWGKGSSASHLQNLTQILRFHVVKASSVATGGVQGLNENAEGVPVLSAEGRYVAFVSGQTNLVGGDTNGLPDLFVHDRVSAVTTRVNVRTGGGQATVAGAESFDLSDDGRYVVFWSGAPNLVDGDDNGASDVRQPRLIAFTLTYIMWNCRCGVLRD